MLRLGLPLATGSEVAQAKATLFLAIVDFVWPTHDGRQCWDKRPEHG